MSSNYLHKTLLPGITLTAVLFFIGCNSPNEQKYLFKLIPPNASGIHFNNQITETEEFNILNFHYIYNGGGVGVGDFNKDGLADLVFSGNEVDAKLYLNRGDFAFDDISQTAGFISKAWTTGVSIVDINGDGWSDIYLSVGGLACNRDCHNQLFIHQGLNANGIPQFKEMAKSYGLEDGLYTQQALFFDYDSDGDLDVYLLHNLIDKRDKNAPSAKHLLDKKSYDYLMENRSGVFVNVSAKMGIEQAGYGLGVTIADFNEDELPDIYIANDFLSDDIMYINQGKSPEGHLGFKDVRSEVLKHNSYNAMGVDVADVNNDQLADIVVLDMLPEHNERQKSMLGFMNYNKFEYTLKQGYSPQFIRNTLQVHNGLIGNSLLPFSELGYATGIYNTDWSWTPLLADYDNDGDRDLYVTNGYGKDITDLDFINYSQQQNPFGTPQAREKELYEQLSKMESVEIPNYIFEQEENFSFKNRNNNWLPEISSISNGAAYADLDNDGDLDLIVNNINSEALILENQTDQFHKNNYIKIRLQGTSLNSAAIGAKVKVYINEQVYTQFHSPVRGYLSAVDDVLHFGLGEDTTIDSIVITHPFYGRHKIGKTIAGQTLNISLYQKTDTSANPFNTTPLAFEEVEITGLNYTQQENPFRDFDIQPLLLKQYAFQGPCLASADVDGSAGEEIFIGGARGYPGQLFFEQADGSFISQKLSHPEQEDTAAAFFDFDQDGDMDLYVVSGGSEVAANDSSYQDRLYLNNGKGEFSYAKHIPSPAKSSGSCVVANDFDQDGDIDLFVGGRISPFQYPKTPRSYLIINHEGKLLDYTDKLAQGLDYPGMVSGAVWSDYDQNGWEDLIIAGEWMPVMVFKNNAGHFAAAAVEQIENSEGLWNCITAFDYNDDGVDEYILGNLGLNSRLTASKTEPLLLYQSDFDGNGSTDPLIGQYVLNKKGERDSYPIHARDDVVRQLPIIKDRYTSYADFGDVSFTDLLQAVISSEDYLKVTQLNSCLLQQGEDGKHILSLLPMAVQEAPIQAILPVRNENGKSEVLLVGNDYSAEKNNGWYDALNGLVLSFQQDRTQVLKSKQSGFLVPGDARSLITFNTKEGREYILAGQNRGDLKLFRHHNQVDIWQ